MSIEEIEYLAKEYTEGLYYKIEGGETFSGEPLAVYNAFISGYTANEDVGVNNVCDNYVEGINMQCSKCDNPKYKHI